MLHNDAAQQQPGEKPALAPKESQKSPWPQGQARLKIPTLQRPRDTNAASRTDGNMDTTHIIHIHGRHSPPTRLDLTHTTHHMQQRQHGTAEILRQKPKLPTRLARDHPFGEGHAQARSVLGPEQGTEQGQLARHETKALQQHPEQSQHTETPAEPWHDTWAPQVNHTDTDTHSTHTAPPAPRLPRHDSDTMQNSLHEKYRHAESAPWSARYHPPGEGHGLTGTVLGLVQGSEHEMQFLENRSCRCRLCTRYEGAR